MAYDYFQQNEEDQDLQGQPRDLSGGGTIITGNNGGASPDQSGAEKKTSSGSFTPLNSYLDANKSLQFGQQVAGKVGDELTGAETAQDQAESGFKTAADQGATKSNDDLISKVKSSPQDVATDDFAKQRDAYYKGPQAFTGSDYSTPASTATDKAYNTAQQTKDEGGRKAYLDQTYGSGAGRSDYSAGQQKLDNLLIQADPSSKAAFEQTWQRAGTDKDRFGTLSSALDQYASKSKTDTDAARGAARGAIGIDDSGNFTKDSDLQKILDQAEQGASTYNSQQTTRNNQALDDFKSGKLSPEDYAMLGADAGTRSYRVDPSQYLQTGPQASRDSVLSTENQARVAALARLAGKENTYAPNAAAAGTYDPSKANTIDRGAYSAAVEQAKASYQQQLAEVQAQLKDFEKQYANGSTGLSITAMNQRNAAVAAAIQRQRQLLTDYAGTLGGTNQYDQGYRPTIASYETQDPQYQVLPGDPKVFGYR